MDKKLIQVLANIIVHDMPRANRQTIAVYFHSRGMGLRIRYCTPTVFPLDYDKNANQKPGFEFERNFNDWCDYIKKAVMPEAIVQQNYIYELIKGTGIKQPIR